MSSVTPDYERDGITMYCADCLDILPQLPDGCVDAVVTDPPYGIGHPCDYASRRRGWITECRQDWPDVIGDDNPFDPAPILAMGLPTILWGANHYGSRLPDSSGWLVWDKHRPDDLDQATCELAWTNCVKGVRRFSHLWNGCMRASERKENYHATQKPVALYMWCLSLRWTVGFHSIFDPYMGAGPGGVACIRTGRKFIGIEKERKYFDIAVKRIEEAFDSQGLFRQDESREPDPCLA